MHGSAGSLIFLCGSGWKTAEKQVSECILWKLEQQLDTGRLQESFGSRGFALGCFCICAEMKGRVYL